MGLVGIIPFIFQDGTATRRRLSGDRRRTTSHGRVFGFGGSPAAGNLTALVNYSAVGCGRSLAGNAKPQGRWPCSQEDTGETGRPASGRRSIESPDLPGGRKSPEVPNGVRIWHVFRLHGEVLLSLPDFVNGRSITDVKDACQYAFGSAVADQPSFATIRLTVRPFRMVAGIPSSFSNTAPANVDSPSASRRSQ